MNWAAFHLVSRRALEGLYKMPSFYRKKSGTRKLSVKEKTELFLDQDILFLGGGGKRGEKDMESVFIMQIASSFNGVGWGIERVHMTD